MNQLPPLGMPAFELVQLPAFGTTAFELIQKPPLWTTAIELFKSRRSRRRQLASSKAAVHVAGFCLNQKPALVLPASWSSFGIILKPILILFLFFKNTVFPYKTLSSSSSFLSLSKGRVFRCILCELDHFE